MTKNNSDVKIRSVSYKRWGYIFIAPFFIIFSVFALVPLFSTFYYSVFENYTIGLEQVGPNFVGLQNFETIIVDGGLPKYFFNTIWIFIIGFIPQIIISLMLAAWFTNLRLKLRFQRFFKTVMYMPNMIMAAAFSMLFWALFSDIGPVNNILNSMGLETFRFFAHTESTRGIVAFINTLMWFGNTTILLMGGILAIDISMFESARIDGATAWQIFGKVTLPLIKPILIYVLITSLIGGIQMFDVPQILTDGQGTPNRTSMTIVMYLNKHLFSKNYGLAGAVSVILSIVTAALSFTVFRILNGKNGSGKRNEG